MSRESKLKGSKIPRYTGWQKATPQASQARLVATDSKITNKKDRSDEIPKCRRQILKDETFEKDMKGLKFEPDEESLKSILNNQGIRPVTDERRNTTSASGHRCSVYYQPSSSRMSLIESQAAFKKNMQLHMEVMRKLNIGTPAPKKQQDAQKSENSGSTHKRPCSVYFSLKAKLEMTPPTRTSNSLQNTPKTNDRRTGFPRNCLTEIKENVISNKLSERLLSEEKKLSLCDRHKSELHRFTLCDRHLNEQQNLSMKDRGADSVTGKMNKTESEGDTTTEKIPGSSVLRKDVATSLAPLNEENEFADDRSTHEILNPAVVSMNDASASSVTHLVWSSQRTVCTPTNSVSTVMANSGDFSRVREYPHGSTSASMVSGTPHRLDFGEEMPGAAASSSANVAQNVTPRQRVLNGTECVNGVCRTPVTRGNSLNTIHGLRRGAGTPTFQAWTPSPAPARVTSVSKGGMGGLPGRTPVLSSCLKKKVGQTIQQGTQSTTKKKLRWLDVSSQ
ncbi:uncharacterized protein LOC101864310 isoform X2 [Aplysia californica]|uniref:Uncharacterized protein LOC101864310 isoform X2 n=1 Tax=Aplysia californica TaxID=6500 RepID=A0ABM0JV60_APLCA|nr:uncharacterized protein LOC101864310 isoform X2 [Aplysia californica]